MNVDQLLHPEKLSNAELVRILRSLNVVVSEDDSRFHLLGIFRKVALPLPQRETKISGNINRKNVFNQNEFEISISLKREPAFVDNIIDCTKKIKLNDIDQNTLVQVNDSEEINDHVLQKNHVIVDFRRENLKRRLLVPSMDGKKRIKISQFFSHHD